MNEDNNHTKWLSYMKQHEKTIAKYSELLMADDYPVIRGVYFDLPTLKDTRLGTLLCLAGNEYEEYIVQHLHDYNIRLDKLFLSAFPDLPYAEDQVTDLWYDKEFSEDIFDFSPDTVISLSIKDLFNTLFQLNDKVSYRGKIKVFINCFPLSITPNINIYSKILQEYLTDRVDISLISIDPIKVDVDIWRLCHFLFLDSIEVHTVDESTLYSPLFMNRECLNKQIFTSVEVAPKQKDIIKEKGFDINDPEQLKELMTTTYEVMNMWCHFNYCVFDIPLLDQP